MHVSGYQEHDFLCTGPPTGQQLGRAALLTIRDTPPTRDIGLVVWGATRARPGTWRNRKFERMIGRPLRVSY